MEEIIINGIHIKVDWTKDNQLELVSIWRQLGLPIDKHPAYWAMPNGLPWSFSECSLTDDYKVSVRATTTGFAHYMQWAFGKGLEKGDTYIISERNNG